MELKWERGRNVREVSKIVSSECLDCDMGLVLAQGCLWQFIRKVGFWTYLYVVVVY